MQFLSGGIYRVTRYSVALEFDGIKVGFAIRQSSITTQCQRDLIFWELCARNAEQVDELVLPGVR